MKIYLTPPQPSRGLQRIADALVKYKPEWVEVVDDIEESDQIIVYAIGRRDKIQELTTRQQPYAIIQVCLRSTQKPSTLDWLDIWQNAEVVWSYYDLEAARIADGGCASCEMPNFYHAPLGVESEVFYQRQAVNNEYARRYVIATTGLSYLSESVRECWLAASKDIRTRPVIHLGSRLSRAKGAVFCHENISDDKMAEYYSQCEFVSALRRKEGFELPAAEGLLCGARPIAFDTPDYRWIYKSWAEYVHEGTRQEVVDQLIQLFRQGARPVTQDEINEARQWFHWPTIVGGFYERLK